MVTSGGGNNEHDDTISLPLQQTSHEGEHHGDVDAPPVPISSKVKLFALCASINSTMLGYDVGVSAHTGKLIQQEFFLSDMQRGVYTGIFNGSMGIGALISPMFNDRFGRRITFTISSLVFLLGLTLLSSAQSYTQLLAGRIIGGIGAGIGCGVDPLYIAEIAPASHRGELVSWSELGVNVGIMVGYLSSVLVGLINEESFQWRTMLSVGIVLPCIMIFVSLAVLAESPRFLVLKDRDSDARRVLRDIYPEGYNVDLVIEDIHEGLEREIAAEQSTGWSTILSPTPAIRRILLLGWGITLAQQAVGIDSIQYFLVDVLEEAGIKTNKRQNLYLVGMAFIKIQCIALCSKLVDFKGRRFVFFLSLIGMAVSLFLVSLSFTMSEFSHILVAMIGLTFYLGFYGLGVGPTSRLVPTEIFSTCIRAKALSVAVVINRAMAAFMAATFLPLKNAITWPGFFMLLALVCAIVAGLLYCYLPETARRSLEDMTLYFAELTDDSSLLHAESKVRSASEALKIKRLSSGNLRDLEIT